MTWKQVKLGLPVGQKTTPAPFDLATRSSRLLCRYRLLHLSSGWHPFFREFPACVLCKRGGEEVGISPKQTPLHGFSEVGTARGAIKVFDSRLLTPEMELGGGHGEST